MANVTYTKRFLGGTSTPTAGLAASPPSGFVWVVRSIDISTVNTGVTGAVVGIVGVGNMLRVGTLAQNTSVTWDGRQVVNAGEQLVGNVTGAGCQILVTGYELSLP